MLKWQQWFLNADRGQQDALTNSGRLGKSERVDIGVVVDGPGVRRRPGAGRDAGHKHIKVRFSHAVAFKRSLVGDVSEAQDCAVCDLIRAPVP